MRTFFNNTGVFKPIIIFIGIIWMVQIINFVTSYSLNPMLGLSTRQPSGLIGIIFCPLLHGSFNHVALNTAPLALLGGAILSIDKPRFLPATAIIIVMGGALTWLLARPNTLHVGASGLVFGYFGFLIAYGIRVRSVPAIIGALLAIALYGYLMSGVLPSGPGVSFEGHLFGLIAGVLAAFILPHQKRPPKKDEA
jgi:membrane associated rhomboid family serine protease